MRRLSTIMLAVRKLLVAAKTYPATYTVTLSNPINMTLTNTSATGTITGKTYPATFNVLLSNPTNATLATATGVGTITSTATQGGGGGTIVNSGTITSSLATARVTGVAPLYVNFDATGTTGINTTNPMHELLYVWNFGDVYPANMNPYWVNGMQVNGLNDKNVDYGPVTGHVYETPGTYSVLLLVMDGVNVSTQSVTITVQDPNTVYSGTNTICFSQTSDFTGAPTGSTQINTAGVTDMMQQWNTYAASGKRLLWNKAQTWGMTNQCVGTNLTGLYVGGFGTGVTFSAGSSGIAPTGTAIPITPTFSSFGAMFAFGSGCSDIRICEIKVTGTPTVSVGALNYSASQVTWYKNEISGHSEGWNAYPGGVGGAMYMEFDQHCMYECYTTNTSGSAFIDDGSTGNSGGCAVFNGHTRGGVMGCYFDNINHGEQTVRFPHLSLAHLNHNYIARPNQAKNIVKIHAVDYGWMPVYTEKFVFSSNLVDMRGGYTIGSTLASGKTCTTVGYGMVLVGNGGTSANERCRTGLFENNYSYGTRGNTIGIVAYGIGAPGCTVRNNIVDAWHGPGNGTDTSNTGVFTLTYAYPQHSIAQVQTSTPDPTINTAIYNNTYYSNCSNSQSMMVWQTGTTTANTIVKNNIHYLPYQGYWATTVVYNPDGGTVTASNNSANFTVDPKFAATPPVLVSDWKLQSGSYGVAGGTAVPVLNDFYRSTEPATPMMGAIYGTSTTNFDSLGILGGNIAGSADYIQSRFYQNAFLDSRGFNNVGTYTGGNSGITVDSNGWPTGPSWAVISGAGGGTRDGNLTVGTYHCSYQSTGQATNMSVVFTTGTTVTNIVKQPDGLTTTFDINVTGAVGTNQLCLGWDGAVQNVIIARNGQQPNALSGVFNQDALNHYSKFNSLRFMDWLGSTADPAVTWASRKPFLQSTINSLERAIDIANAIYANPGSKLKYAWLNMPPLANPDFGTQAATLVNTRGNNNIQWIIEIGNEPWNTAFPSWGWYKAAAEAEVQIIASYAATNTVSSVVRASNVTTVTLTGPLPSFVTNGAGMNCWCDNNTFAVGTPSTPVTVTVTGTNTFTYPNVQTDATMAAGTGIAFIFNLASTLIAKTHNVTTNAWLLSDLYYTRAVYNFATAWHAVRPQDKFVLNLQQPGQSSWTSTCGDLGAHLPYAEILGGGTGLGDGSASNWLWGAAIAPYFQSQITTTTVTDTLTELRRDIYATNIYTISSHVYKSKKFNVEPVSYEGGPDSQNAPTVQVATHTDPRMKQLVTELLNVWYRTGGHLFHYYGITPHSFTSGAQGAWSSAQEYSDASSSPKHAALLDYLNGPTEIKYGSIYGRPGQLPGYIDLTQYMNTNTGGGAGVACVGWWTALATSYYEYLIISPITKTYTFTMYGSDGIATSQPNVLIDGVVVGSPILGKGGSFVTGSPGPTFTASTPFTATLTAGPHILRIAMVAGKFSAPCFNKLVIT